MTSRAPLLLLLALALAHAGCSSTVCGDGTESKFDPSTGVTICTSKIAQAGVQCDPTTTKLQGGMCVADATRFPHCGAGTTLDQTMACVPMMGSCGKTPPACPPKPGKFSVAGLITHLNGGKFADGETIEVRVYDPLAFLRDTSSPPEAMLTTTDSTYCFDSLTDAGGQGLLAIAFTDASGTTYALAGVGLNSVAAGGTFRADGYLIEKTLVAQWDTGAALSGMNTFEAVGAYVVRFFDKPRLPGGAEDPSEKPVGGVTLTGITGPISDAYYFKDDLATVDKSAMATDAATGAVVARTSGLTPVFTGKGGMVNGAMPDWERVPGGSTAGVVFVQTLHPQAM